MIQEFLNLFLIFFKKKILFLQRLDLCKLPVLEKIDLSGNKLKKLECIPHNSHLRHMKIKNCHLKQLPETFHEQWPSLKTLHAESNLLCDVRILALSTALRKIMLCDNDINSFHVLLYVAKRLAGLERLDLRINPITAKFYPNVGLASRMSLKRTEAQHSQWSTLDTQFQRELNDTQYMRRIAYRSSLMCLSTELQQLDGIVISSQEKTRAQSVFKKISASWRHTGSESDWDAFSDAACDSNKLSDSAPSTPRPLEKGETDHQFIDAMNLRSPYVKTSSARIAAPLGTPIAYSNAFAMPLKRP